MHTAIQDFATQIWGTYAENGPIITICDLQGNGKKNDLIVVGRIVGACFGSQAHNTPPEPGSCGTYVSEYLFAFVDGKQKSAVPPNSCWWKKWIQSSSQVSVPAPYRIILHVIENGPGAPNCYPSYPGEIEIKFYGDRFSWF